MLPSQYFLTKIWNWIQIWTEFSSNFNQLLSKFNQILTQFQSILNSLNLIKIQFQLDSNSFISIFLDCDLINSIELNWIEYGDTRLASIHGGYFLQLIEQIHLLAPRAILQQQLVLVFEDVALDERTLRDVFHVTFRRRYLPQKKTKKISNVSHDRVFYGIH